MKGMMSLEGHESLIVSYLLMGKKGKGKKVQ